MDFLAEARREANTVVLPDGRRVSKFAHVARGGGPRGPPPPADVGSDVRTLPIP